MSKRIHIGSNIGYLIAAFAAYYTGKTMYSYLLFLLVVVSSLYHLNKAYYPIDVFVSLSIFLSSGWYLYHTQDKEYEKALGLLLMILMFMFLYINGEYGSDKYNNTHPFAHLFGGLSTIIVALYGDFQSL